MYAHSELTTLVGSYLILRKKKDTIERSKLKFPNTFSDLFNELRQNDKDFFDFFHMNINTFDELYYRIKSKITFCQYRETIPPIQRLALTLRYFAKGCSLPTFQQLYGLPMTTTSLIIPNVSMAIWQMMKSFTFPWANQGKWKSSASGFERVANFPNCIGAIILKRIYMKVMKKESNYVDLLVVCDTNYKFCNMYVDSDDSDEQDRTSRHYLLSKLKQRTMAIPGPKVLPNTSILAPHVFVSENSFDVPEIILTPYRSSNITYRTRIFDHRLKRALRYAEKALDIFLNRFEIFQQPLTVNMEKAKMIIKACGALHNFILSKEYCQEEAEKNSYSAGKFKNTKIFEPVPEVVQDNPVRDVFADYFISETGKMKSLDKDFDINYDPIEGTSKLTIGKNKINRSSDAKP